MLDGLDWTRAERREVPLHRIRWTALSVRVEGLLRWHAARELDPIRLVERGGELFLFDGHHRTMVATLRGDTTIAADVLLVA